MLANKRNVGDGERGSPGGGCVCCVCSCPSVVEAVHWMRSNLTGTSESFLLKGCLLSQDRIEHLDAPLTSFFKRRSASYFSLCEHLKELLDNVVSRRDQRLVAHDEFLQEQPSTNVMFVPKHMCTRVMINSDIPNNIEVGDAKATKKNNCFSYISLTGIPSPKTARDVINKKKNCFNIDIPHLGFPNHKRIRENSSSNYFNIILSQYNTSIAPKPRKDNRAKRAKLNPSINDVKLTQLTLDSCVNINNTFTNNNNFIVSKKDTSEVKKRITIHNILI